MHSLKKIAGKEDPERDKNVEKEVEQIKTGLLNKIYPILKPGDWVGIKAGALKQTLVGTPENPELVVAFGYDAPTSFVFLMSSDLQGKDKPAIIKEAYDNLENIEPTFEVSDRYNKQIIFASGNDFSSEKILCHRHMMKAHQLLNSKELLVSIPRRSCMMITSKHANEKILDTFVHLHGLTWDDGSFGNAQILDVFFVVVDGQIEGVVPL